MKMMHTFYLLLLSVMIENRGYKSFQEKQKNLGTHDIMFGFVVFHVLEYLCLLFWGPVVVVAGNSHNFLGACFAGNGIVNNLLGRRRRRRRGGGFQGHALLRVVIRTSNMKQSRIRLYFGAV